MWLYMYIVDTPTERVWTDGAGKVTAGKGIRGGQSTVRVTE